MSFEKDVSALKVELLETEQRIKKLQEHKELEVKKLGNTNTKEIISRLDRNIEKLEQKRQLILKELES